MSWSRTKTLTVALFLSLAVNLFLGGAMVGRWGWHGGHNDLGGGHWGAKFWLSRALGEDAGGTVEKKWNAHQEDLKPLREKSRLARAAVQAALSAEPFDPAAYDRALKDSLAKSTEIRTSHHAFMVDLAGSLTAEQRAKLADFAGRKRWRRDRD